MEIYVSVSNQKLKIASNLKSLVAGTQEFIRFTFALDKDWDGLTTFAQFIQNDVGYNQVLDSNNSAYLPAEIVEGTVKMLLYGVGGNTRATTNYITLTIDKNHLIEDAQSTAITQSVYQQLVNYIDSQTVTTEYVDAKLATKANASALAQEIERAQGVESGLRTDVDAKASQTDLTALEGRVTTIEENPVSTQDIADAVSAEIARLIEDDAFAELTIGDGTLSRAKVNSDFEDTLDKADNSWQKSSSDTYPMTPGSWEEIYDPQGYGHRENPINPYEYAAGREDSAITRMRGSTATSGTQVFNVTDSSGDAHPYTGVDSALNGVYSLANSYTRAALSGYTPINIEVVQSLPETGASRTFYLIPNGDKYEKWWYITDENHVSKWDNFGASTTEVVNSLPIVGEADTDYILAANGEYQYYKYINNQWVLIAGSNAEMVGAVGEEDDSEWASYGGYYCYIFGAGSPEIAASSSVENMYIDTETMVVYRVAESIGGYAWASSGTLVSNPSESKDYFVQDETRAWGHFRYLSNANKFIQIGSSAYTRDEIDEIVRSSTARLQENINANSGSIDTLATNLSSLSRTVSTIRSDVDNIDTEGDSYYHAITHDEETGNYTLTLYKVHGQDETIASQSLLPAGGGGGGGQTVITTLVVDKITQSPLIITTSDSAIVVIDYSSTDTDGETYGATYNWKLNGSTILSGSIVNQGRVSFDLSQFCTVGTQKFTLTVTDEPGTTVVKSWTIQKVDVRIESSFSDRYTTDVSRSVNFTYTPYGAINKTVHFKFDGVETTETTSASGTLQSHTIPAQNHGAHLLEVWMTATVNGANIETNHIYKDIIWYDASMTGGAYQNPVIGCIYRYDLYGAVTARQYDTTPIVYNVFDPSTNYPVIKRYVDNVLVGTDTLSSSQAVWNYKSSDVGNHTLRIECGETSVTIVMTITELGIDVAPVTGGLEIDFNPTGITNSSANRIWSNGNYHMTVSNNFDWANGGYKTDENGDTYFLVKAGTNVSFDYEMFGGGINGNPSVVGAEMKIIFMTENVQDIGAVWLSNVETTTTTVEVDGQEQTSTIYTGIQMSAHNGWLKTNKASDTSVSIGEDESADTVASTNTYLYMPYSEEDIIEMDINIDTLDREEEAPKALVMAYEDGVPSKAYVYDSSDRFYQYNPQPLVIGSQYCDVRIYRLKIYSTSLTTENIMKNFIADSRDSTTMLNRYDRNSIYYNQQTGEYTPYSSGGVLTPERLAQVIPNVKVLMLETDHFTTSKKTFVKSSLRCIHAPGGDVYPGDAYYDNWLFENGWHSGQGTTSDNYGNAGRNVDFLFNCDGTHKPSDKIKNPEANYISQVTLGYGTEDATTEVIDDWKGTAGKVSLTRTSIPNNFFNLKVNIASSENVNNWLMQKRYNDFLPYISPAKQRDSRIKNDMEFVPAVLFVKETNPSIAEHKEFMDNEWHFYALGNIGDSKKTDYTRAYDPTDMNEFTIEISDNDKNNATFQSGVYDSGNGVLAYESFHLVKTLDKDGELVVTPVPETRVGTHIYPVPAASVDNLLYRQGTITVDNRTGSSEYDGNETGYLNMRMWCLYNEAFDGDHSFEPRYACCGDYRDGKLVNDYSGYGKQQVKKDEGVLRAFYKWVITSTDEEFVDELEQWCVKPAVEFFYAFTLYYTMMDNRAKNTFWHFAKTGVFREVSKPVPELLHVYCEYINDEYVATTDVTINQNKTYYTEYAFDFWMYDGDTALGINNNGELVFPYGKEDTDYEIEGDSSSKHVFNGATSTFFCRLRDLLSNEISETFNSVIAECFSANNLIEQFDRCQECFPEEIWRRDIERKYIRTFTGESVDNSIPKQDSQYLRDMMQGRKKYQRRQWIRDQEMYFGTKYLMNTVVGDNNRITFRCYDPGETAVVPANYSLSITPFSDMYVSAMFGNGDTVQRRAKANEAVTLTFNVSTSTDTQVTIYGANRIAALNDLSACYISANNFSMATKLRKLVLGNPTVGYSNPKLTSLTLGQNKLLEELDLRNCGALTGAVNLSYCNNLLKLLAEGTKITGVAFSTNGKVRIAHLPNTINTLTMRNLNNLTDFQCDLDYLETITLQGGLIDSYQLISDTIDTLQVAYLYDIDWVCPDTSLLNSLANLYYSLLTGSVTVSGQIRLKEIEDYNVKWSDLTVNYSPENVVVQHIVTFVNYDGSVLYTKYVDQGDTCPEPITAGAIQTPTREPDQQYVYTFSGWDNLSGSVIAPKTVTAQYSTTTRTYTVNWYHHPGLLLKTTTAQYGEDVVYDLDIPTWTDGEGAYRFRLFKGWDKSTGRIVGDTNVYALWDDSGLPASSVDMSAMTPVQIYGVCQAGFQSQYFEDLDYTEITLGHDFNFSNVESCEIGNDVMLTGVPRDTFVSGGYYFNGSTSYTTNIKLFEEDSPAFTMVIDFQFSRNVSGETLVSGNDRNTAIFRLVTDGTGAMVYWGDQSVRVGYGKFRDIVAIRHPKGSRYLYVYAAGNQSDGRYNDSVTKTTLLSSTLPITSVGLSFGGVKYDSGYRDVAAGHVHWCKIWYDDIGEECAYDLAAWPREKIRMEYWGVGKYYYSGTSTKSKASFICNSQVGGLTGRGYYMNSTNINSGGWDSSKMRTFLNARILKALPKEWQAMIKTVEIKATKGSQSTLTQVSDDKIYLPSYYELGGSGTGYNDEIGADSQSPRIPWFTGNQQRIKFRGKTRKYSGDSSLTIYTASQDPAALYQTDIEPGTIWINSGNNSIGYIFVSQDELDEYGITASIAADSDYANGGWCSASSWWGRSPNISYSTGFYAVSAYGNYYSNNGASNIYGVVPGFSI